MFNSVRYLDEFVPLIVDEHISTRTLLILFTDEVRAVVFDLHFESRRHRRETEKIVHASFRRISVLRAHIDLGCIFPYREKEYHFESPQCPYNAILLWLPPSRSQGRRNLLYVLGTVFFRYHRSESRELPSIEVLPDLHNSIVGRWSAN